ncbi:probable metal-dependent amidase/aminoacylase/carboxypeptidase [Rhynchosporium graminicola]|uniref:Probable metal-dependent amidase/aminoacylase/carboxypeptidase n=1 Tax=Rhynchosporium graminicola TaxID=2792576 RepID=A0A1E1K0K5_9HELO|nr:probable metal-dependent amidase/aminoacylase/carboxypeptidase [Rhynchosporium commune]
MSLDPPTSQSINLSPYEELYKHFHANPELSNFEVNTSQKCLSHLIALNVFTLHTNIGGHGLVGVFPNGPGKTIMLRADMDALPVLETTGLSYSSTITALGADGLETPVMHACGHDMHMTCLLAASEVLVRCKDSWGGTLIVLFQPAEERGSGARAMFDDGLYARIPIPDFVLGQHVMAMRAGSVGLRSGTIMAGADSLRITLFGKGGHGSQPHRTVDPAVLAAHVVVRLQSVVSREVDYNDIAVLTIGSVRVGQTENIISAEAVLGVDFRSTKESVRDKLVKSIERIVKAECLASGCVKEPKIERTRFLPNTVNDEAMSSRLKSAFGKFFGRDNFEPEIQVTTIAEDFSILASVNGTPCVFWHWGGVDPVLWDEKVEEGRLDDIPMNHSSGFSPSIQPTLKTGVDTLVVAALEFFGGKEEAKL